MQEWKVFSTYVVYSSAHEHVWCTPCTCVVYSSAHEHVWCTAVHMNMCGVHHVHVWCTAVHMTTVIHMCGVGSLAPESHYALFSSRVRLLVSTSVVQLPRAVHEAASTAARSGPPMPSIQRAVQCYWCIP
eukprot:556853-Pelagomonas_calceolata.AAC.2